MQVETFIDSHSYSRNDLKQIRTSWCNKQSLVSVPSNADSVINMISMHLLFNS